jgi:hypothetical protein
MNTDQIALLNYIRNLNAKTLEWVAAGEGRFACTLVEDLAHWAESKVHTVNDFIKYDLATEIYDGTKSAYGYRPHWGALMQLEIEDLETIAKELREAVKNMLKNEEVEEAYYQEELRHENWLSASYEDRHEDLAEAAGF